MEIVADSAKNNFGSLNKSLYKLNKYADELGDESEASGFEYGVIDPSKIKFQ